MTAEELTAILTKHATWLRDGSSGARADLSDANLHGANLRSAYLSGANLGGANLSDAYLSGADLSDADLSDANLHGADLSRADLSDANLHGAYLCGANLTGADLSDACLCGANLSGADLSGANLSGAILSGANLHGADLSDANLHGADLSGTCLDPALHDAACAFTTACPADADGFRVVYRTARSQHIGSTEYLPGQTYDAPVMSWDSSTACHPGIYAGSLDLVRAEYPTVPLVRCHVRDGDWTITAKGFIRCTSLTVLEGVQ